jgi:hypothetical protein
MAGIEIKESVMDEIMERNQREDERDFEEFCHQLLSLPANLELKPKENFKADIELQPLRWMSLGIDLFKSRKVIGHIQLAEGIQGPETGSYLPYPVFQMATEIFLKGMWLCQFADCRQLNHSSYVDEATRNRYYDELRVLSHDLLRIIDAIEKIPQYQRSVHAMQFLKLINGIVRAFYFPPYEADKRNRWADGRYPKRVYDDSAQRGHAEGFQSFPEAKWIEKLFREMETEADRIWQLRNNLKGKDGASHIGLASPS